MYLSWEETGLSGEEPDAPIEDWPESVQAVWGLIQELDLAGSIDVGLLAKLCAHLFLQGYEAGVGMTLTELEEAAKGPGFGGHGQFMAKGWPGLSAAVNQLTEGHVSMIWLLRSAGLGWAKGVRFFGPRHRELTQP